MDPRIKRVLVPVYQPGAKVSEGNGHWIFDEPLGQNGEFGFIYVIRNLMSGRSYIGKKQFLGTGKINRNKETNWQRYISSSNELSNEISMLGKDSFEFVVLEQYKTRGALTYAEVWSIMQVEAFYFRDKWYNRQIEKVSWITRERITERHKTRLKCINDGIPLEEVNNA